jgi:TRAP-type mannitol/chloroaromatic compound transport system substrate-binding protein
MLGGGRDVLNEFYKKYNCVSLLAGNTGCQMGGWFRKEINTPDDLKGLKFRIGGFAGRVLQKLGVVPQQIAGGDIYPALEKGTIDGAEWVGPYDDERLGFYKVAPHYYYPGWWEGGPMLLAFVNIDKWNALPKYYQSVLEQAGHYANNWMMARYDQANPQALRKLLANGAKLHAFSPPIMEACFKAAKELHGEVAASNPDFKKVLTADGFSNNGYQWFKVAGSATLLHGAPPQIGVAPANAKTPEQCSGPGLLARPGFCVLERQIAMAIGNRMFHADRKPRHEGAKNTIARRGFQ